MIRLKRQHRNRPIKRQDQNSLVFFYAFYYDLQSALGNESVMLRTA